MLGQSRSRYPTQRRCGRLVVAFSGEWSKTSIRESTAFQEQWFDSWVELPENRGANRGTSNYHPDSQGVHTTMGRSDMNRRKLAQEIRRRAYLHGEFVLRSGITTDQYFDKYRFESDPDLLRDISEALVPLIPSEVDVLAGLELGGIPLATMMSQLTGLPTLVVRKKAKEYGTRRLAEGGSFNGRTVAIVEDVVTTAGQIVSSARHLIDQGGRVVTAIAVVDRGQGGKSNLAAIGIELRSLFSADEVLRS